MRTPSISMGSGKANEPQWRHLKNFFDSINAIAAPQFVQFMGGKYESVRVQFANRRVETFAKRSQIVASFGDEREGARAEGGVAQLSDQARVAGGGHAPLGEWICFVSIVT